MKMSITRALVELKNYDDKITRAIHGGRYVAYTTGQNQNLKVSTGKSVEETNREIQSSFDKVNSLMANRAKLKAAIVKSNANTIVNILGTSMTVAEAIDYKTQLPLMEAFYSSVSTQNMKAKRDVETANAKLEEIIEKHVSTVYGNDKSKVSKEVVDEVRAVQERQLLAKVLDPVNVDAFLSEYNDKVSNLRGEIDFTLSESNARTEIEVDL